MPASKPRPSRLAAMRPVHSAIESPLITLTSSRWMLAALVLLVPACGIGASGTSHDKMAAAASKGLMAALGHEVSVSISPTSLIETGKFEELETASKAYETAFKLDPLAEASLMKLYVDICQCRSPALDLLVQLDRWVATRPSYMSLAARGMYFAQLGYAQRGGDLIRNTPPSQIAAMKASHERALRDLDAALRLNPKFVPSYLALMQVHQASGSLDQAAAAVAAATKEIPRTYYVRAYYLRALRPKWGGSFASMKAYADTLDEAARLNPRIWSLKGEEAGERADVALRQGDYAGAVKYYTQALEFGDRASFLKGRSQAYQGMGEFRLALDDLQKYQTYNKDNKEINADVERLVESLAVKDNAARGSVGGPGK